MPGYSSTRCLIPGTWYEYLASYHMPLGCVTFRSQQSSRSGTMARSIRQYSSTVVYRCNSIAAEVPCNSHSLVITAVERRQRFPLLLLHSAMVQSGEAQQRLYFNITAKNSTIHKKNYLVPNMCHNKLLCRQHTCLKLE